MPDTEIPKPFETSKSGPADMARADAEPKRQKVNRDAFLARSGKYREDWVAVPGVGDFLVREISGRERAAVIQSQAKAARGMADLDVETYQWLLLLYGVVDPDSPEGARLPMLRNEDRAATMAMGAKGLDLLSERIEELSGLTPDVAALVAEDFPGLNPNGSSGSESPTS